MKVVLNRAKHPFYQHSDAEFYVAYKDGRPAGRIAAIDNRRHVEFHDEPVGFFGFFECVDDEDVARSLFQAAEDWLRPRGLTALRGPTSFSTNDVAGLLIEGFDSPPVILMPYNPRYYERLLFGLGFERVKVLLAYEQIGNEAPEYLRRATAVIARRTGARLRPLDMKNFDEELAIIQRIYADAWEKNWGFVPMTEAEVEFMARELKPAVNPELVPIAELDDGTPVGFAIALPDYNHALIHLRSGRLFPLGLLKLLWYRRSIYRIRILALGLVEGQRGRGIDAMLYQWIFDAGRRNGITHAEFGWVLEDNEAMRRPIEKLGSRGYKRYGLYEKPLDAAEDARPAAEAERP
jgi:GNAT superfamily N-acetyltransferase